MINNKVEQIKEHIQAISDILGIKESESNSLTALRVAKMLCEELFQNRNNANIEELNSRMKLFPNPNEDSHEEVTLNDIRFNSMCEHHWLPFIGLVNVSYVPDKSIVGLSKIPRVVKYFSKKPQLQERLTKEIGEYLVALIRPRYLRVVIRAKHTCVMCRGAESDCSTKTFYEYRNSDFE